MTRFDVTDAQWHQFGRDLMQVHDGCDEVRSILRLVRANLVEGEFADAEELEDAGKALARSIDTLAELRTKPLGVIHMIFHAPHIYLQEAPDGHQ